MSAYLVSPQHIKLLAVQSQLNEWNASHDIDGINEAAKILWEANCRSINARYGDDDFGPAPKVEGIYELQSLTKIDPVVVLKQCQCYDYQACEFDGYNDSEAKRLVESVQSRAISRLPGYEDAKWGI